MRISLHISKVVFIRNQTWRNFESNQNIAILIAGDRRTCPLFPDPGEVREKRLPAFRDRIRTLRPFQRSKFVLTRDLHQTDLFGQRKGVEDEPLEFAGVFALGNDHLSPLRIKILLFADCPMKGKDATLAAYLFDEGPVEDVNGWIPGTIEPLIRLLTGLAQRIG